MLTSWKKSYDQPRQHIKKQRHYFANKGPLVKTIVFPVVMYGYESWTIKKVECQRTEVFELWWWRGLLRVPGTARRSNQSILKKTKPECSLEGLMLKLKLQYFGHLMLRTDSLEKTLILGKIEGRRRRGRQRMRWLDGITDSMDMGVWASSESWWWTGKPGVLQSMGSQRVGHDWATEMNWPTKITLYNLNIPQSVFKGLFPVWEVVYPLFHSLCMFFYLRALSPEVGRHTLSFA